MKLKLITIADRGVVRDTANRERLHLSVLADTNLVYYAVFDTKYAPAGLQVFQIPKHTYWFSSHAVKAGDNVVLYTGPGVPIVQKRPDGGTNHFFYWGMERTLWNQPGDCAVVVELNAWEASPR